MSKFFEVLVLLVYFPVDGIEQDKLMNAEADYATSTHLR